MMCRHAGPLTLLAAVVLAGPLFGQPEKPAAADPAAKNKELMLLINKLQDSLTDLQKRLDQMPTEQTVDSQIRKALAGQAADLDAVRRQVDQLQREVAALRGVTPRVSAYPSGPARIRLVNTYPTLMGVIVNGQFYRLAPGEERTLDNLPAGPFTYEVIGAPPPGPGQSWPQSRTLAANETFTITVYPR